MNTEGRCCILNEIYGQLGQTNISYAALNNYSIQSVSKYPLQKWSNSYHVEHGKKISWEQHGKNVMQDIMTLITTEQFKGIEHFQVSQVFKLTLSS